MKASESLAAQIRRLARQNHVEPAVNSGKREFSISVRELMQEAEAEGISTRQRTPPFCTSIQTDRFQAENGIQVVDVDGPKSKRSTTVVVHYRVTGAGSSSHVERPAAETPEERAFRLTEKLRGLIKHEIAAHGGTEGFLTWVRSDEESA